MRDDRDSVSVVVAVHNMKEHIRQCIESVLTQSHADLELILVDDVSTDGTAEILHEYERKDDRVRVIHQSTNGGAQLARNAGVAASHGRYVVTLDHDDFFDSRTLELAVHTFRSHPGLECVCLREIRVLPDGTTYEYSERNSFGVLSGEEAFRRSIGWRGITGRMIVTRELQERFPFDNSDRVYGEDNTAQLQLLASREVCSSEGIYYHRILPTSLSHKISLNNIRGNLRFISLRKSLKDLGYGKEILRLNEEAFWLSVIGAYDYYHIHRHRFSAEDKQTALQLIKTMRENVDFSLVPTCTLLKPGRMKMPSWWLFTLQEDIYFSLRDFFRKKCDTAI